MPNASKANVAVFIVKHSESGINQYGYLFTTDQQLNTLADLPKASDRLKFAQENMKLTDFRLHDDPDGVVRPARVNVSSHNPWGRTISASGEATRLDNEVLEEMLIPAAIDGYVQLAFGCTPR